MKYLLILTFVVLANQGFSQNNKSSYNLRDCIDYALSNNITVQQAQVNVENSHILLNQSKAAKLPTLNGSIGANGNTGRNVDPFTNGIVTQTIGTNNMGVGLSIPIYQGGRLNNAIERDRTNLEATQMDVAAQQNSIAMQVTIAYLNVLSSEDLIEISQRQLDVTQLQYDKTLKLVRAGALPETNLYDFEAQKANDELSLINAENSRESAFLSLKRTMNAPSEMMFEIVRTEVPNPDALSISASANDIFNTALGFLPEIKAGDIRLRAADVNIAIAKSVGMPSLSFSSSWGTAYSSVARQIDSQTDSNQQIPVSAEFEGQTIPFLINFPQTGFTYKDIPYFKQLGNNQNFSFGLSLNIPIFNRFNTRYQTQAAQVQKKQVDLQNQSTQLQIKQNIDQAYLDMLNAKKKYAATLTQTEALEKAFGAAEIRYNAGAGTFVDYNLAKTNLDRAKTNLVVSKYDYIFKIKILDFYQNKPLDLR